MYIISMLHQFSLLVIFMFTVSNLNVNGQDVISESKLASSEFMEDDTESSNAAGACWGSSKCSSAQHPTPSSRKKQKHLPPQGFQISAHVVTDDDTGLSYFVSQKLPLIQYVDCGPSGSSTDDLHISSIQFRHFPPQAETGWGIASKTSVDGLEQKNSAQLIVCLNPLEVTVSGNAADGRDNHGGAFLEKRLFAPGEIVLLHDTYGKGHKLKSTSARTPLSILTINLPLHNHHTSLFGRHNINPDCHNNVFALIDDKEDVLWWKWPRKRWISSGIGAALASALASWFFFVYPPILVRLAEIACILGLTSGLVIHGDFLLNQYMRWKDEKRFSFDDEAVEDDEVPNVQKSSGIDDEIIDKPF